MKHKTTLKERYAVSTHANRVVEMASSAIESVKVWRHLRAEGLKRKRCREKLREARRCLREALGALRLELGAASVDSFPMWCVLDRANLRSGWAYFNLYPSERQAEKTAKTIREKGNREAVVVKVRIPLPEGE